ncbi:hypothetical protein PAHAL_1G281700 [Panicum hallii]|uniref:Uncharacterized protein n=1 Tax=Panicum hallii TaxID=206008 RepID=A0A2S3GQ94_9POAL|nr:cell number regulator 2-like [Panicum hallii]PAN06700.1 hypothetical protein PAHAL_1G281700 [Panicum hallii]
MQPKDEEEGAAPAATGFPVSGGGGGGTGGATAAFVVPAPPAPWSTGLFDCFDDVGNCCVTCLFPCITFGQVAEIVDRGSTSCGASAALYTLIVALTGYGFQSIFSCFYRAKLRAQFGLEESPCPDCLVHFFCEWCALCQEYRELSNRGFDMNIGWHANMERQGHAAATMPPQMQPGMTR